MDSALQPTATSRAPEPTPGEANSSSRAVHQMAQNSNNRLRDLVTPSLTEATAVPGSAA